MDVRRTVSHLVQIFRFDEVPIWRAAQQTAVNALTQLLGLQQIGVGPDETGRPQVLGQIGQFQVANGELIPVLKLALEDRRILLSVEGTTDQAHEVLRVLARYLAELGGHVDDDFPQPLVTSYETEFISRLGFQAERLVSPVLLEFVNDDVAQIAGSPLAQAVPALSEVKFIINYQPDPTLEDYRVSFSRKEFVIGPRAGYPVADQMYTSKAPIDSDAHIRILKKLEAILSR